MTSEAHLGIIDRNKAIEPIEKNLQAQTQLLRNLVDYGSNLLVRSFNSSPRGMAEVVLCGVLLKQVIAMVDAAEVLISAGCGHAAYLPIRSAFEASLYIEWIMESDTERRATRYIVATLRNERLWCSRVTPGTAEEKEFTSIVKTLGLDICGSKPEIATEAESHLAEVNRILSQPQLATIDKEFDSKRGKRKSDIEWYKLDDNVKSIREVAKKVNRLSEYEFFYAKGSNVVHGSSYKDHISFSNSQIQFKPIRHLADINTQLIYIVSSCITSYKRILERYRPGETMAFSNKYMTEWRDPFINAPKIDYAFSSGHT